MNFDQFKAACEEAFRRVRGYIVPHDTGNLANNALQYRWEGEDGMTFHLFVDEEIAPYMVFTNEPWIAARWRGKKNPNEGWWKIAAEVMAEIVSEELGGKLKHD